MSIVTSLAVRLPGARRVSLVLCALLALVGGGVTEAVAQLELRDAATGPRDPETLVRQLLAGTGVEVLAVEYAGVDRAVGSFQQGGAGVGIDRGIVMTTGQLTGVGTIVGVDGLREENAGYENNSPHVDANLEQLAAPLAGAGVVNAARYRITFVPKGDNVRLRYSFASEDYEDYVCADHVDVMGMFLSGPGLAGPFAGGAVNIATVPGGTLPVNANTINPGVPGAIGTDVLNCTAPDGSLANGALYVDAVDGTQPAFHGRTVTLTAESAVQACETYVLEIAIGDALDASFDSGLFLEASSFTSDFVEVGVASTGFAGTVAEGCTAPELVFTLDAPRSTPTPIDYVVAGTATEGVDFGSLPPQFVVPAGDTELRYAIPIFADGTPEADETLVFDFPGAEVCQGQSTTITVVDRVIDPMTFALDTAICAGASFDVDAALPTPVGNDTVYGSGLAFPETFGNSGERAVPITVAGLAAPHLDATVISEVCVDLRSERIGYLDLALVSPAGNTIELTSANGPAAAGEFTGCFTTKATVRVDASGDAPTFTGDYLPEQDWADLGYGPGNPANGTWTLVARAPGTLPGLTELRDWSIAFNDAYEIDYAWTPSGGLSCDDCPDPVVSPTSTTDYVVTATDSYGCTESGTARVVVRPPVVAPALTCTPDYGEVNVAWTAQAEVIYYEVVVNAGAPVNVGLALDYTVMGLVSGQSVNVEVRAVSTCEAPSAAVDCAALTCATYVPAATVTDVSCFGSADGSIALAAGGGVAPFTYELDSVQQASNVFAGLATGNYRARVFDANGCGEYIDLTVGTSPPIVTTTSTAPPTTCGAGWTATASASGGSGAGYRYAWDGGSLGATAVYTASGTYYVDVTDGLNCTVRDSVVIALEPPLDATYAADSISCAGSADGAFRFSVAGGRPPYSYSKGGAFFASDEFTGLDVGVYTFTVRDAVGCTRDTTVRFGEPLALTIAFDHRDVSCFSGDDALIRAVVGNARGPIDYAWSGISTTADSISGLVAGTYDVTATDAAGCVVTGSYTVTQPDLLTAALTPDSVRCFGESTGAVLAEAAGGTPPYLYTFSTGTVATSPLESGLPIGSYTVVVTDANGCDAGANAAVEEPPLLEVFHTSTPITCFGETTGSIDLTAVGGNGGYTYAWDDGSAAEDRENLAAGTYEVLATDRKGCALDYAVTLTQPSKIYLDADVAQVSCFGAADASIFVDLRGGRPSATGAYAYVWRGPGGREFYTDDISQLVPGTYELSYSDEGGCNRDTTFTITQPDALTVSAAVFDSVCYQANDGSAALTILGGTRTYDVRWSNGETDTVAVALPAGRHEAVVEDANGCRATAEAIVHEVGPLAVALAHEPARCFGETSGEAFVTAVTRAAAERPLGGFDYAWERVGAANAPRDAGYAGDQIARVRVTDARGCSARGEVAITQPDPLGATATVIRQVACFGTATGVAEVTVVGGNGDYAYDWGGSASTPDLPRVEDLSAGVQTVSVIDGRGCETVAEATLLEPVALTATATVDPVGCSGPNSGSAAAEVGGGTAPYTYAWSSGSSDRVARQLTEGSYSVTVTDANDCRLELTGVTVPTVDPVMLTGSADAVTCAGKRDGIVRLAATDGRAPYVYSVDGAAFTTLAEYAFLPPGTYAAVARDRDGCLTDTLFLGVGEPQPLLVAIGDNASVVAGESVELSAQVFNAAGEVSYAWSPKDRALFDCRTCPTVAYSPLSSGSVSVTVTDANGCEAEDRLAVDVARSVDVLVPTGFTPNGDGTDDVLHVHGRSGTEVLTFEVFNRWGELVYRDADFRVNDLSRGWDGRQGGEYVAGGVFVWRAQVRYLGGAVATVKGQTTAIR